MSRVRPATSRPSPSSARPGYPGQDRPESPAAGGSLSPVVCAGRDLPAQRRARGRGPCLWIWAMAPNHSRRWRAAARLRKLNPTCVLGRPRSIPLWVAGCYALCRRGRPIFGAGASICPWGTNLGGQPEVVRCIRAFNVLRQYEEAEVAGAYAALARRVLPGGLLVEGTSDPRAALGSERPAPDQRAPGNPKRWSSAPISVRLSSRALPARAAQELYSPDGARRANCRFHRRLETNREPDVGRASSLGSSGPGFRASVLVAGGGRLARGATEAVAGSGLSDPAPAVWP